MTTTSNSINNQRLSAIIAGISLLIMTLAAFFSYGYVHSSLVVSSDPVATFKNIQASRMLFQLEILGWIIIIITDILVSWGFYIFLKPINSKYSLLACLFRLIYTGILAIAVSFLVRVNIIVNAYTSMNTGALQQTPSQVMTSISAFESIWSIGLIIFGIHLVLIGFVALKAKYIPKFFSYLLIIAGLSYILLHILNGFFPHFETANTILETILSIPMFIGEIGFGIWLLFNGRKIIPN